ncbi:MAG: transketolase family protein [Chloroflexi bacterium]|nr:transketolase family protein [Chloroflexota bacterium]
MSPMEQTRFAYGEALLELGQERSDIVVLDADLYNSTRTVLFGKAFPERFLDLGIAEADMVSTGAGLAASGLVAFCNSFAMFLTGRCYDQIRIQVAYPSLNVKLAGSSAGLTQGPDGASHQSLEDVALMRILPHMTVLVPADDVETKQATKAAAAHQGPVYLRLGRYPTPTISPEGYQFQIGKGVELRPGRDIAIIACGIMVAKALEAAELLAKQGLQARVINMASVKPLDRALVEQAGREAKLVVTAEEHSIIGGLGSAVAEVLAEGNYAPLWRIGTRDEFGQSASADELLDHYGLTGPKVAAQIAAAWAKLG